jgi:hypothetical protein
MAQCLNNQYPLSLFQADESFISSISEPKMNLWAAKQSPSLSLSLAPTFQARFSVLGQVILCQMLAVA